MNTCPPPARRRLLRAALGLGALAAAGPVRSRAPLAWQRRLLTGFGTTLSLQAGHADAGTLARALDAGVAALQRIDAQMSLFDDASALSRLNRDGELRAPPAELREVLSIARAVSRRSEGAFDVTVQPLWLAWAAARREGRLPDPAALAAARALAGWRDVELSADRIRLRRPGMALTLNGIAQGYAADRVRQVLVRHGIRDALVDAGEFAMEGADPARRPWTLGVARPRGEGALLARLLADGRCVATSADDQSAFTPDLRHHHILDPHTGDSPPAIAGVSVAAARGALADALTKVMFIAGPARIPALARAWGVDVLWIEKSGRWQATPGLALDV